MIRIRQATSTDITELTTLATQTFIESHGHSAPKKDIDNYIAQHYTVANFKTELSDPRYHYYLLFYKDELAGFSKIIFNQPIKAVQAQNIAKLERIYVLEKFHGQKIGRALFNFNKELAETNNQVGLWLFTWVENERAIKFYEKNGFKVVGDHNFKISDTHSNPNWQYYLALH